MSGQDALRCRVGNSTSSSRPCAFGTRPPGTDRLAVEAGKRSAAQSLINHTPSSNTASIRLPGAAVGVPPAGVALEERGAKGSSVVRVQVLELLYYGRLGERIR